MPAVSSDLLEYVMRTIPVLPPRHTAQPAIEDEARTAALRAQRRAEQVRRCLCQRFTFTALFNTQEQRTLSITIDVPEAGVSAGCTISPSDAIEDMLEAMTARMAQVLVNVLCAGLPESWTVDEVFQEGVQMLSGAYFEGECATFISLCLAEFLRIHVVRALREMRVVATVHIVEGRTDRDAGNTVYLFNWSGMQEPIAKRVSAVLHPQVVTPLRLTHSIVAERERRLAEVVEDTMYARSVQAGAGLVVHALDNRARVWAGQLQYGGLLHRNSLNGLGYVALQISRALQAPVASLGPQPPAATTPTRRRRRTFC